jgi:hypothetical protein
VIVLVCGGRDYDNYDRLSEVLEDVAGWSLNPITILEGGARGADSLARRWAKEQGLQCITVPADWEQHGRAAGPIRNARMLKEHPPDQGVVFPGGRGTQDMLIRLFQASVNTWVVGS